MSFLDIGLIHCVALWFTEHKLGCYGIHERWSDKEELKIIDQVIEQNVVKSDWDNSSHKQPEDGTPSLIRSQSKHCFLQF